MEQSLPTRETILLAMGFSTVPTTISMDKMRYYIISHSLWNGDILKRYLPRYFTDLIINHDEYYDIFYKSALLEYGKLTRYMRHCESRGNNLNFFQGKLHITIDSSTNEESLELRSLDSDDLDSNNEERIPELLDGFYSKKIYLNKQKIRHINKTRTNLLNLNNKIREQIDFLFESRNFLQELSSGPIPQIKKDVYEEFQLQNYIHNLLDHKDIIQFRLNKCYDIQSTQSDVIKNLENLQRYKLEDDLNMRSIEICFPELTYYSGQMRESQRQLNPYGTKNTTDYGQGSFGTQQLTQKGASHPDEFGPIVFPNNVENLVLSGSFTEIKQIHNILNSICVCPRFEMISGKKDIISRLPYELADIIRSYVGEDYLESVRQTCIMERYFISGRDDVMVLLKKWRNNDLLKFSEQVFLKYTFNIERNQWRRKTIRKSSKKVDIIENIIEGKFKLTFYDFLRDVFIVTKILNCRKYSRG